MDTDMFGNQVSKDPLLRDKWVEPPFSFIDTRSGHYKGRKKMWSIRLGGLGDEIRCVSGRNNFKGIKKLAAKNTKNIDGYLNNSVSIFDPALCELMYKWFAPASGHILDPFCGGSVRGIVANYLGYEYTGIDIRQEQIDSNREQALKICPITNQPQYYVGDSNEVLNGFNQQFDFIFSCPPYSNLEVYSNIEGDISNMSYDKFLTSYNSIINKSCKLLKSGAMAVFVVGEVRDNKGNYKNFVSDTISSFLNAGMAYYNEIIYLNGLAGAFLTAGRQMDISKKIKKVHQNVLVFKKP